MLAFLKFKFNFFLEYKDPKLFIYQAIKVSDVYTYFYAWQLIAVNA